MPRCSKRAAATEAEGKIKVALRKFQEFEEESRDGDRSATSGINIYEDIERVKRKKSTKDHVTKESHGANKGNTANVRKHVGKKEKKPNKKKKAVMSSEEIRRHHASKEAKRRRKAAEKRRQHSNRPMILSRRLSTKLCDPDLSPMYSPIAAIKLWFTPDASPNNEYEFH